MTGDDRPADSSSTQPQPDGTEPPAQPAGPPVPSTSPASGPLPTNPPPAAPGAQPAFGPPGQPSGPVPGSPYGQVVGPSGPPSAGYPAGQQPPSGTGPVPSGGYPSGQQPSSGTGPVPSGGYPSGQQPSYGTGPVPSGGYPSGQQPSYGTGPVPSGGYPSGQQPGYPSGGQPPAGYPSGQQPTAGYPSGQQPASGYPSGQQPAAGYPSGQQPAAGYPSGQQPSYGTGQQPAAGYPSGQPPAPYGQPAGYPSGQQPGGGYQTGSYGLGQPPSQPGGQYYAGDPQGGYQQGGYQQGGYQQPGGYPGQPDYLGAGYAPAGPPPRKRRRALWAIVASATAVALTAGGVTAYTLLAGSGVTLDTQLPRDSVAYAELNLDPPAGQKVAALRFFHHFSDLKVREDAPNLLEGLLEPLLGSADVKRQYEQNIKPWVGKHAAAAVDPQGAKAEAIVVIEATDAGKARTGLDALRRTADGGFGYVIKDKIVVLARTESIAQAAVSDAGKGSLHDNGTFQGDLKSVGTDGTITLWADLAHVNDFNEIGGLPSGGGSQVDVGDAKGRVVGTLKFTDSAADVVIRSFGTQPVSAGEAIGPKLGTLPDDTVAAVALGGGDKLVKQAYQALKDAGLGDQMDSVASDLDMTFPDDLIALVGTTTVVAVGGSSDEPAFGAITRTTDVDRAKTAAEKLSNKIGNSDGLTVRTTGDSTVFASSADYAGKLAAAGGLGNSDLFKAAMPELAGSQFAMYVDVRKSGQLGGGDLSGPGTELRAFGLTASTSGDASTLHLRLVV